MDKGTSWPARGIDLKRIKLALQNGDVRWNQRTAEWLAKNFDRIKYNQRIVNRLIYEHVKAGKLVKAQRTVPGQIFKEHFDVWFSVEIEIEGTDRFIKFGIEPEDDDNPGLLIMSTHPPH